ncbi:MAG TPA: thioredoxin domain-containing protein [Sphingobium sp.]|nr:thioredoxin domain-containing protein [Sphingobium sp.]
MKKCLILLPALLSFGLAACGDKKDAPAASGVKAGEVVPPPAGTSWSNAVRATPEGGYVKGNPEAAIRIVEFGSFTCSHCADFSEKSANELDSMVDTGKMSFEFRPYVRDPLDMTVALLAGCSGPEPFFALSHQLFAYQPQMFQTIQAAGEDAYRTAMEKPLDQRFTALARLAGLIEFAKQRGISEEKAGQCLTDPKKVETLAGQVQKANDQYEITGTPTLLMNGSVMENVPTWDALKAKLKEAGV